MATNVLHVRVPDASSVAARTLVADLARAARAGDRPDTMPIRPSLFDALGRLEAGEDPLRCEWIARRILVPRELVAQRGSALPTLRARLIAAGVLRG